MSTAPADAFPSFRSDAAQAQFEQAYDTALAAWPVPHQSLQLETGLGPTHVIASGATSAPAVVLLPSFSATALLWAPNVAALSACHRVYAVDVVGQPGLSRALRKIRRREDFSGWLSEVLDALHLRRTALVGASFGAFLAANQAIAEPLRVERLALIGPAGVFVGMSPKVILRLISGGLRRRIPSRRETSPRGSAVLFSPKVTPPPPDDPWRRLMDLILQERPRVSLISPTVFRTADFRR